VAHEGGKTFVDSSLLKATGFSPAGGGLVFFEIPADSFGGKDVYEKEQRPCFLEYIASLGSSVTRYKPTPKGSRRSFSRKYKAWGV
jgi:hypothetical protein